MKTMITGKKSACIIALMFLFVSVSAQHAASFTIADAVKCNGKGHGLVYFQGSGTLLISGDGVLVVSEDAETTFASKDSSLEPSYEEPECMLTDEGSCVFILENEKAWISGENITVSFAGANIGFTASGDASLILKGYGIYRMGNRLQRWAIDGSTIVLENN